jgi:hypothetical protein
MGTAIAVAFSLHSGLHGVNLQINGRDATSETGNRRPPAHGRVQRDKVQRF